MGLQSHLSQAKSPFFFASLLPSKNNSIGKGITLKPINVIWVPNEFLTDAAAVVVTWLSFPLRLVTNKGNRGDASGEQLVQNT